MSLTPPPTPRLPLRCPPSARRRCRIDALKWHPLNEDQLVVSSSQHPHVHMSARTTPPHLGLLSVPHSPAFPCSRVPQIRPAVPLSQSTAVDVLAAAHFPVPGLRRRLRLPRLLLPPALPLHHRRRPALLGPPHSTHPPPALPAAALQWERRRRTAAVALSAAAVRAEEVGTGGGVGPEGGQEGSEAVAAHGGHGLQGGLGGGRGRGGGGGGSGCCRARRGSCTQ